MKVKDLDFNEHRLNLKGRVVKADEGRPRSSYHLNARNILKQLFPTVQVLEEVPVTLRKGKSISLDFFISQFRIVVEVHGQQHYKFTPMFHASAQDFIKQKKRDADLKEWCELNNFTYIELRYDEKPEEWINKINMR